jgi:hypothetical protein
LRNSPPTDAGCYVDGHWGQYGTAHLVRRAVEFGYPDSEVISLADKHLASMGTCKGLTDDEYWTLSDAGDVVIEWLNENVTPEGYEFGWYEGEVFLWSDAQWQE